MLSAKEERVEKHGIGIIVGRFHVPALTEGHKDLIESVIARHDATMIVLGLAPIKATKSNPLDFETRRLLIHTSYPNVKVMYINDNPSNSEWIKALDKLIDTNTPPNAKVTLYGSRESFLETYQTGGKYKWTILEPDKIVSGTKIREVAALESRGTEDFRRGVIWATQNQYDKVYTTVDVVPFKRDEKGFIDKILFAGKKEDLGKLRFIGGFTDPKYNDEGKGDCLEYHARREAEEESHAKLGDLTYLGSFHIPDWRYRSEKDKINTTLFMGEVLNSDLVPDDDIDVLQWVHVDDIKEFTFRDKVVPFHHNLLRAVISQVAKDTSIILGYKEKEEWKDDKIETQN